MEAEPESSCIITILEEFLIQLQGTTSRTPCSFAGVHPNIRAGTKVTIPASQRILKWNCMKTMIKIKKYWEKTTNLSIISFLHLFPLLLRHNCSISTLTSTSWAELFSWKDHPWLNNWPKYKTVQTIFTGKYSARNSMPRNFPSRNFPHSIGLEIYVAVPHLNGQH